MMEAVTFAESAAAGSNSAGLHGQQLAASLEAQVAAAAVAASILWPASSPRYNQAQHRLLDMIGFPKPLVAGC